MAASGIGASDMIAATITGAKFGRQLLWALLLGSFLKFILSERLARWQLATGRTILEGWARYLPRWVLVLFIDYLVMWSIAVSGALVSACGLATETLSMGHVPRTWGGLLPMAAAYAIIRFGGRRSDASRWMKPLIALMFFTMLACAALTLRDPATALRGLLIPTLPPSSGLAIFSIIGGIGGSVTLLAYSYLLREESAAIDLRRLPRVRLDLAISYGFTAVFGISVVLIAERVFFTSGTSATDRDAVAAMAVHLQSLLGPAGYFVYAAGFWSAVAASLLGVWQTIPGVFADAVAALRQPSAGPPPGAISPASPLYRTALLGMTLAGIPFAFIGRPVAVIVGFTILGSLFIPFLAATLLLLNRVGVRQLGLPGNRFLTNALMWLILLLFLWIGAQEILALLDR